MPVRSTRWNSIPPNVRMLVGNAMVREFLAEQLKNSYIVNKENH